MDINQIEWCPYLELEKDYMSDLEYLEWRSARDGNFSKNDVRHFFRSICLSYARLLSFYLGIDMCSAIDYINSKNIDSFEEKLKESFEVLPYGCGISHSKMVRILSVIYVPKIY